MPREIGAFLFYILFCLSELVSDSYGVFRCRNELSEFSNSV